MDDSFTNIAIRIKHGDNINSANSEIVMSIILFNTVSKNDILICLTSEKGISKNDCILTFPAKKSPLMNLVNVVIKEVVLHEISIHLFGIKKEGCSSKVKRQNINLRL